MGSSKYLKGPDAIPTPEGEAGCFTNISEVPNFCVWWLHGRIHTRTVSAEIPVFLLIFLFRLDSFCISLKIVVRHFFSCQHTHCNYIWNAEVRLQICVISVVDFGMLIHVTSMPQLHVQYADSCDLLQPACNNESAGGERRMRDRGFLYCESTLSSHVPADGRGLDTALTHLPDQS
jgi:hypothetical protein